MISRAVHAEIDNVGAQDLHRAMPKALALYEQAIKDNFKEPRQSPVLLDDDNKTVATVKVVNQ